MQVVNIGYQPIELHGHGHGHGSDLHRRHFPGVGGGKDFQEVQLRPEDNY